MSNTSGPSGERNPTGRGTDPASWRDREADNEIANLRNALDEHLRNLDTSQPPPGSHKSTTSSPAYSYHQADSESTGGASSDGKRSGIVAFAAVTGLVLGAAVTISLASLERSETVVGTVQTPPQAPSSPVETPQPKQVSTAPSRESAAPDASRREPERTEGGPAVGSNAEARPESTAAVRWQACLDQDRRDAEPPQPGETWWPVVGPSESLDDARRHCRADAFINRSGNAQISSFRDRDTATAFAEQLTQDSSHQWRFWVGDASVR
jgi:hypothetical protein